MDEKQIWLVLETEPTKEEEQIKQAYRKKLARTNPEDDPEGFKRLREAYEQALRLATQTQEPEEELPEGPVGDWLWEVKEAYGRLSSRLDTELWASLLEQEDVYKRQVLCSMHRQPLRPGKRGFPYR